MKLQLLIPQYQETEDIVQNMLNSIQTQQGIDFNDIEILIGNDGSDIKLSQEFLSRYSFSIKYLQFEHEQQAATRQKLFDQSTADYVMFCDADDMFLSNIAIYTILMYIEKGFDALVCAFMEELQESASNRSVFVPHNGDTTFVHGKVYRRQHLIDNNIKWYSDIKTHEDGSYNTLAITTAKQIQRCKIPIYLWKWRDNSICREDKLYVLKTYTRMIHSNAHLIEDFISRKMIDKAKEYVAILTYGTYFMLNKPIWLDPMNAKYRYETEKCFKEYFEKHKDLFTSLDAKKKNQVIARTKQRVLREGVILEQFTFDAWMKHIDELD